MKAVLEELLRGGQWSAAAVGEAEGEKEEDGDDGYADADRDQYPEPETENGGPMRELTGEERTIQKRHGSFSHRPRTPSNHHEANESTFNALK